VPLIITCDETSHNNSQSAAYSAIFDGQRLGSLRGGGPRKKGTASPIPCKFLKNALVFYSSFLCNQTVSNKHVNIK